MRLVRRRPTLGRMRKRRVPLIGLQRRQPIGKVRTVGDARRKVDIVAQALGKVRHRHLGVQVLVQFPEEKGGAVAIGQRYQVGVQLQMIDVREIAYYRNVYDHLVRFSELIESSREMARIRTNLPWAEHATARTATSIAAFYARRSSFVEMVRGVEAPTLVVQGVSDHIVSPTSVEWLCSLRPTSPPPSGLRRTLPESRKEL